MCEQASLQSGQVKTAAPPLSLTAMLPSCATLLAACVANQLVTQSMWYTMAQEMRVAVFAAEGVSKHTGHGPGA